VFLFSRVIPFALPIPLPRTHVRALSPSHPPLLSISLPPLLSLSLHLLLSLSPAISCPLSSPCALRADQLAMVKLTYWVKIRQLSRGEGTGGVERGGQGGEQLLLVISRLAILKLTCYVCGTNSSTCDTECGVYIPFHTYIYVYMYIYIYKHIYI